MHDVTVVGIILSDHPSGQSKVVTKEKVVAQERSEFALGKIWWSGMRGWSFKTLVA